MNMALLVMLSIIAGTLTFVAIQLTVIVFQLGDLKAYTITAIDLLQQIRDKRRYYS